MAQLSGDHLGGSGASFASAVLGPAIAAITLVLVAPAAFGERLGRNARYAAMGNAVAAGVMGACGYYLTDRAVFLVAAALGIPALVYGNRTRRDHRKRKSYPR
jgi:hypothetical protein